MALLFFYFKFPNKNNIQCMVIFIYIEFEVTIESQPKLYKLSDDKNSKGIVVTGCRYKSPTNMNPYSYWLLDDEHKMKSESSRRTGVDSYEFKDLPFSNLNVSFQCVIENENIRGKKVISDKAVFLDLRKGNFFYLFRNLKLD